MAKTIRWPRTRFGGSSKVRPISRILTAVVETIAPMHKRPGVAPPVWKGQLDDPPDVYLLVPGSDDMGIKWREGKMQIKRAGSLPSGHTCSVVDIREARTLNKVVVRDTSRVVSPPFCGGKGDGAGVGLVRKTRALRKVRLETLTGKAQEVGTHTFVDRGRSRVDGLEVAGAAYCSLAFEAFPTDAAMDAAFTETVEAFVDGLTAINLAAAWSLSYPAWLRHLWGPNQRREGNAARGDRLSRGDVLITRYVPLARCDLPSEPRRAVFALRNTRNSLRL